MEWFILIVPAIMAIFVARKYPRETVWWEFVLMFVVCLAALLGAKLAVLTGITTDTEYRTSYIARTEYREAYSETYLAPVKIGRVTTLQTRTRHHPARWTVFGEEGSSRGVDETYYQYLLQRWPGAPSKDGHTYTHVWNRDPASAEFITSSHSYENRLQASYSVYRLPEVSDADLQQFALQPYPDIRITAPMILGDSSIDRQGAERLLHHLNSKTGSIFKCQVWIVLFRNQPERAAELQEALWQRGNRHEYVLCISVDERDRVQWTRAFSWTKSEALLNYGREIAQLGAPLNLPAIVEQLEQAIRGSWEPRNFDEFKAIHVAVPIWGLILIGLVTCGAGALTLTWAVKNQHWDARH